MMGKKVGKTRGRKNKIKMKKDWHTCENRVGRKKKKKRLTHIPLFFFFFQLHIFEKMTSWPFFKT